MALASDTTRQEKRLIKVKLSYYVIGLYLNRRSARYLEHNKGAQSCEKIIKDSEGEEKSMPRT